MSDAVLKRCSCSVIKRSPYVVFYNKINCRRKDCACIEVCTEMRITGIQLGINVMRIGIRNSTFGICKKISIRPKQTLGRETNHIYSV